LPIGASGSPRLWEQKIVVLELGRRRRIEGFKTVRNSRSPTNALYKTIFGDNACNDT